MWRRRRNTRGCRATIVPPPSMQVGISTSHTRPTFVVRLTFSFLPAEDLLTEGQPQRLYKKMEMAGKGGFGRVYKTRSSLDKKQVAVKKMPFRTDKERNLCLMEIHYLRMFDHE